MSDRLIDALEGLDTEAPEQLVDASLVAAGIAHGYVTRPSPLGTLYVAFSTSGVTSVDLAPSADTFRSEYEREHGRAVLEVTHAPDRIERHLDRAIVNGRPGPLPLDLRRLTEFQRAVLHTAASIPTGEVRPYGWIAREIGKPGAVRAVGSALARNPVPIVIPCHRVVRSDGQLGNYSLGDPSNKRVLLEQEGMDLERYEKLAMRGVRFTGSDTTRIFCHPTCHPALTITDPHLAEFGSADEAIAAGYRPCKVCRPVTSAA